MTRSLKRARVKHDRQVRFFPCNSSKSTVCDKGQPALIDQPLGVALNRFSNVVLMISIYIFQSYLTDSILIYFFQTHTTRHFSVRHTISAVPGFDKIQRP